MKALNFIYGAVNGIALSRYFNNLLLLVGLFAVALLHFVGELTVLNNILSEHLARTATLLGAFVLLMLSGKYCPLISGDLFSIVSKKRTLSVAFMLPKLSLLGMSVFFGGFFVALPFTPAALMIAAGSLHLLRLSYTQSVSSLGLALWWSYYCYGCGFIMLGMSYLINFIDFSLILHLISVTALLILILSFISRARVNTGSLLFKFIDKRMGDSMGREKSAIK